MSSLYEMIGKFNECLYSAFISANERDKSSISLEKYHETYRRIDEESEEYQDYITEKNIYLMEIGGAEFAFNKIITELEKKGSNTEKIKTDLSDICKKYMEKTPDKKEAMLKTMGHIICYLSDEATKVQKRTKRASRKKAQEKKE